ncbi:HotDog domain-containing protein [Elsinoe ampelina]|uniref:HotDog domain-containing protein n=1 Tax=Elsinoe ampelina TaxID=302913 RepID=A0A6A6GCR2_9PEZI|nr:HotDog domain-containing protein [Elsinoe ampelina]
MRLIDASSDSPNHGKLVFEFDNDEHWANNSANLHGGAQATIYDICTSIVLSLIARPGFWMMGGVSRVLSVTYIRPAPVGETLILECEVVHAGKRLAVTKGTMRRKRDGAIVSTCEHNKVNTDPEVGGKL